MIIYQIYPRSFLDTNGDGVGDIAGILRKLDYLQELGVDAIWISPFYASPMRDFGYDIADHRAVDPSFGTMSDFQRLVQRAAQLSIKVLVDLVASHTSAQSLHRRMHCAMSIASAAQASAQLRHIFAQYMA